jgi:TonB family protein
MRRSILALLAMLFSANALADNSDIAAFNTAWLAYQEAAASDDADLEIETAALVLEAAKKLFPESDERLAVITHNYGIALSDGDRREDAVPVLKEAVRLGEAVYGEQGSNLIPMLADLADAEAAPFKPGAQVHKYKRALKIAEANFGRQSVEYADLAFRASRNVYLMSLSLNARKYMVEARDIYAALPVPATQNVGMADFYLGKMEFTDRDFRSSSKHLENALIGFDAPGDANQALRLLTRALLVQTYEHRGLTDEATQHCIAIGRESQFSPDQDYEPLFRVAPMYPVSMLRAGKSGIVDLEFTIDENGFVREPAVIAREINGKARKRSSDFDDAAMDAVKRFRYAPKFENGKAVKVAGVKTRISFKLEK